MRHQVIHWVKLGWAHNMPKITTSRLLFEKEKTTKNCACLCNSLSPRDAYTLTIIGSDNGLSPGRRQAIIWTNAGILLIGPLATNFSEILTEIYIFPFKQMHLKMSSGIWRPFCLGLDMLSVRVVSDVYSRAFTLTVRMQVANWFIWDISCQLSDGNITMTYPPCPLIGQSCHLFLWFRPGQWNSWGPYGPATKGLCRCGCHRKYFTWWRHQMETFSALLAICAGNTPVSGEFPTQRPVTRSFDISLICAWIHGWVNNREAGDLKSHRVDYDATVMNLSSAETGILR